MPIRIVPLSLLIVFLRSFGQSVIRDKPAGNPPENIPGRSNVLPFRDSGEISMLRSMFLLVLFLATSLGRAQAADRFYGFNLDGKVINPLCLEHIHPWLSDGAIIIRSLILDYCQDSNWAFDDCPVEVNGDVVSTKVKGAVDSELTSSTFSYRIVGKTDNGLFIARLAENEIAAYTIEVKTIRSDLFDPKPQKVHVLTQVALSFVPCLQRVWVVGNKVLLTRNVYDERASRAEQCKPDVETVSYEVSP
jgi:hypothetical protein